MKPRGVTPDKNPLIPNPNLLASNRFPIEQQNRNQDEQVASYGSDDSSDAEE